MSKRGLVLFFIICIIFPLNEVFSAGYPTVASTDTSSRGNSAFVDAVTLPSGVEAGDLLVIFHFSDGTLTRTFPPPWVEIKDASDSADNSTIGVAYLIATEATTTMNVTKNVQERFLAISIRISAASWHGTTPPEISTGVTGTSASPNPDSVTASWGSATNLFIAVMDYDDSAGSNAISAYPANYGSNNINSPVVSGGSAGRGGIATRELLASSDDPGSFTITSDEWWAGTIVVKPVAPRVLRLRNVRLRGNIRLK